MNKNDNKIFLCVSHLFQLLHFSIISKKEKKKKKRKLEKNENFNNSEFFLT